MMTRIEKFQDVWLEVPDHPLFAWPTEDMKNFPSCCGAGKFGDKFTPDEWHGISFSPACWVHDFQYAYAPRTWASFRQANSMLLRNLLAWIAYYGVTLNPFELVLITRTAIMYFEAVSTAGVTFFFEDDQTPPEETIGP